MNYIQPPQSHLRTKVVLGLIAILLGAYIGAVYAINNILLGGLHVR